MFYKYKSPFPSPFPFPFYFHERKIEMKIPHIFKCSQPATNNDEQSTNELSNVRKLRRSHPTSRKRNPKPN